MNSRGQLFQLALAVGMLTSGCSFGARNKEYAPPLPTPDTFAPLASQVCAAWTKNLLNDERVQEQYAPQVLGNCIGALQDNYGYNGWPAGRFKDSKRTQPLSAEAAMTVVNRVNRRLCPRNKTCKVKLFAQEADFLARLIEEAGK